MRTQLQAPVTLLVLTLPLAACVSHGPPSIVPKEIDLRVAARFLGSEIELKCPPICMERYDPESGQDVLVPLSFEVCSAAGGCFDLATGETARVPSDATIRAPDGVSPGQELPSFERDAPLRFHSWSDGPDTPRRPLLVPESPLTGNPLLSLITFYHLGTLKDPSKEAAKAGCPLSDVALFLTNRHWVEREPGFRDIVGSVTESRLSDYDFPFTHLTQDYVMWVELSPRDVSILATKTTWQHRGLRENQIHVEWESGSYPTWARPWARTKGPQDSSASVEGDRIWVRGKYIFDCGHSENEIVEGAWTEVHPPIATAVMRGTNHGRTFRRRTIEKELPELDRNAMDGKAKGLFGVKVDVWINGDSGRAPQVINGQTTYPIAGKYQFEVPLPLKPKDLSPGSFLVKSLRLQPGQPKPVVKAWKNSAGVEEKLLVTIDLSGYSDEWNTCLRQNALQYPENLTNCRGDAYGVTILAGWPISVLPGDLRTVRLTAKSLQIYDDSETGRGSNGEFEMTLSANPCFLNGDLDGPHQVSLHQIHPGLQSAPGEGESYPLLFKGEPLFFECDLRADSPHAGSSTVAFYIDGFEDDWDGGDELPRLVRMFPSGKTVWNPVGPPSWAGCGVTIGPPGCEYGNEICFGLRRGKARAPLPYEDEVPDSGRPVGARIYSFTYELAEQEVHPGALPLPESQWCKQPTP